MTGWKNLIGKLGVEIASGLLIVLACVFVIQVSPLIQGLS